MTPLENDVVLTGNLHHEELPSNRTKKNRGLQCTASLEVHSESASQSYVLQGLKYPASSRKSHIDHTPRCSNVKVADRCSSIVQRDIISTKSNRDLMRQISGLGMIDPVYGTREASPSHQSIIFDDMSLGDIPDDFKDAVSIASDHTATDGNGFDSTFFTASLLFSADEHDLPSLDGTSVSKHTKKLSWLGNSTESPTVDFDSLLSGNGRTSPSKSSISKVKDSKPPLPDRLNNGARSKPQDISVKPLSSKEAYRELPASADFLFPKHTICKSSHVSYPLSPRKSSLSKKSHNSLASSPRNLPSLAQIFPEGRPPRRTKETNTTDLHRNNPVSLSAPILPITAKK